MAQRWRNRYRIRDVSTPGAERRLACGICGHGEIFDAAGTVLTDHCISYATKEEALHYQRSKYQLTFVETLDPVQGNFDPNKPEKGRQGWAG